MRTRTNDRTVVVGAGLGGLRVVEALRRQGHAGSLTLIGDEVHEPYDRPPLTKAVLRGVRDSTAFGVDLRDLGVDVRSGARCVAVRSDRRQVDLNDGSTLPYDSLVLAPGAVPRRLPGTHGRAGVHVVRTIDDALNLRNAAASSGHAVVIGGGFIGCEVAASLRGAGVEIDLVEVLDAPLIRVLGPDGARIVGDFLVEKGVRLHTGSGVSAVLSADTVTGVRLDDGTSLATEVLVLGIGVTPAVRWLEGSGVQTADGIVCTGTGRTSADRVWALGDAAAWHHPLAGGRVRIEHWSSAGDQADVVAADIVGNQPPDLDAVPYFWSDILDLKIQALGFIDAQADTTVVTPGGRTVIVYSRDGRLCGVVGFSAARHIMRLRPAVAAGAPVAEVLPQLESV